MSTIIEKFQNKEMTADEVIQMISQKRELMLMQYDRTNPTIKTVEKDGMILTLVNDPVLKNEIPLGVNVVVLKVEKVKTVGERIKEKRESAGLTIEDMCKELNMHCPDYYYENLVNTYPSVQTLIIMSRMFNCSLDYLIKGIE